MLQHWTGTGVTEPLKIYGPPGVEEVVDGFLTAYRLDRGYRIDHHGADVMPPSGFGGVAHTFDLGTDLMSSDVVYEAGDVQVIAFNVDHPPVVPAVGFRVNYKDRSVMITGDTIYSDSLIHHAMGADLLVSDSLNHKMSQMVSEAGADADNNLSTVAEDIQESHIRPEEAAVVACDPREVGAGLVDHMDLEVLAVGLGRSSDVHMNAVELAVPVAVELRLDEEVVPDPLFLVLEGGNDLGHAVLEDHGGLVLGCGKRRRQGYEAESCEDHGADPTPRTA